LEKIAVQYSPAVLRVSCLLTVI